MPPLIFEETNKSPPLFFWFSRKKEAPTLPNHLPSLSCRYESHYFFTCRVSLVTSVLLLRYSTIPVSLSLSLFSLFVSLACVCVCVCGNIIYDLN